MDINEALALLGGPGYQIGSITFQYKDTVGSGMVMSQNPVAGDMGTPARIKVELTVYKKNRYSGGYGSEESPYLIGTIGDYYEMMFGESVSRGII